MTMAQGDYLPGTYIQGSERKKTRAHTLEEAQAVVLHRQCHRR